MAKLFNQATWNYSIRSTVHQQCSGGERQRRGQFSTYIKPVMLILITVLFLFLLVTVSDFQMGMEQDARQIDLQQEVRKDFQGLANCLRSSGAANQQLLNVPQLIEYEKTFRHREPPCSEDFDFGYDVTVQEKFVRGRQYMNPRVDLVFLVDMSASIRGDPRESGDEELQRLCDAQDDIIEELERRGFNVEFTVYGLTPQLDKEISDGEIETILQTTCIDDKLEEAPVGHYEDWANAVTWAAQEYDWRDGTTRLAFPITDECPAEYGPLAGWNGWYRNNGQWMNRPIIIPCDEERGPNPGRQEHLRETNRAIDAATANRVTAFPLLGDPRSVTERDYVPDGVEPWDWHIEYAEMLAEGTGGEYFFAEEEDIEERIIDIVIDNVYIPLHPETTCVLPSQATWGREAELVITAEADRGKDDAWQQICNEIDSIEAGLEQRGWLVNTTVYAPGQSWPPQDGQGSPMEIPDDIGGGTYDHSSNVPECVDQVTAWEGEDLVEYDPSRDYGLSAWGVASKWILENHPWEMSFDKRVLVAIGNHAPTGGVDENGFRTEGRDGVIDTEEDLVNDIVSRATAHEVNVNLLSDGIWGTRTTDLYGDTETNDVKDTMADVVQNTGGTFYQYSDPSRIPNEIMDSVAKDPGAVCTNQEYRFGQLEGSEGRSLSNEYTMAFPVTTERTGDYTTHGTMLVNLRDGDLERLVGAVNNLVRQGKQLEEPTSGTLWVSANQEIYGEKTEIERPVETEYRLYDSESCSYSVTVDTDLVVGVNGYKVFDSDEYDRSTINFADPDNHITGYKGASLQVIATNKRHPDMYLDPLTLECAEPACNETQLIHPRRIDTTDGEAEYDERGRLGVFYYNFTQFNIGATETTEEASICISTPGKDSCSVIRAENIEEFTLTPGRHLLQISYDPETDTVRISE